jgi:hypothetical protein
MWRKTKNGLTGEDQQQCPGLEETHNLQALKGRGAGVRVPVWVRFFLSPRLPDRSWGPPSFLFNGLMGIGGPFTRRETYRDFTLTIHLHLTQNSKKLKAIYMLPDTLLCMSYCLII